MAVLNNLANEVNSYLLKHSKDPIEWNSWGEKAFKRAYEENKPIFLSIGYLSCHWCNVMTKESFLDIKVAEILNSNFINIKVDREERPDIDKFYMNSLLSMGIDGGWPLNVFLLPDGRPFYGGTYFENDIFISLIKDISDSFINHRDRLEEASSAFVETVNSNINKYHNHSNSENNIFSKIFCKNIFEKLYNLLDHKHGGFEGQYKFPIADLGIFLINYNKIILKNHKNQEKDKSIIALELMLDKMNNGGIYDHIGGGFCRYAIDSEWHIPHFEKMLYDNAQLINLYSKSYDILEKKENYKKLIYDTIKFCIRELLDEKGGFYCSISSDSEDEEGKYYTWDKREIINILGNKDAAILCEYFNVTSEGNWDKGKNILFHSNKTKSNILDVSQVVSKTELFPREKTDYQFISKGEYSIIETLKNKLLKERFRREYPIIDDKILTSWNGVMIKGLLEAYYTFDEPKFLEKAKNAAIFIKTKLLKNNIVWHSYYKGKIYRKGYIEDYAWVIRSYLELYFATSEEDWCLIAKNILESTFDRFYDDRDGFFFFSSLKEGELFSNKKYTLDSSIASANAIMCENLLIIGKLFEIEKYTSISERMLKNMLSSIADDPGHFLYWGNLVLQKMLPDVSITIIGKNAKNWVYELKKLNYQNIIISGSPKTSKIPLLNNISLYNNNEQTSAFICVDKHYKKPIENLETLIDKIEESNIQMV